MNKIRVAQVVSLQESVPPKEKNGLEFMVYYLVEELVKRGYDMTLFATKDSKTSAKLVDVLPFPASRRKIFGWKGINYSLAGMTKAAEMADNFDIIHTHIGSAVQYFVNLINTSIIETVHSPVEFSNRNLSSMKDIYGKYIKDSDRRCKKIYRVFVSKKQRDSASFSRNSKVIHNGISLKNFDFNERPKDYFVYLGYITQSKGTHIAVQAAKKAGVKLKIAGNFVGCEEYFKKEIEPNLKKGWIEYIGSVNPIERNKLLGEAKAILVPIQWNEPFGLVMIEAMACGTPVIGFNKASVPEIVVDNKTGFVVENEKDMINAIEKVDEINRFECRKHVKEKFTVERMVDEYEELYREIISKKTVTKCNNQSMVFYNF